MRRTTPGLPNDVGKAGFGKSSRSGAGRETSWVGREQSGIVGAMPGERDGGDLRCYA